MDGKYIDVKGQNVYYDEYGKGEPLLLLHGGFGSGESLTSLGHELAGQYRVIAPDRMGHGRTGDIEGPITYDGMADETIAFAQAIGVEKAHVVGYSDGGILCLLIALKQPDLVSRMVPVSANFHHDGISPQSKGMFAAVTADMMKSFIPDEVAYYEKYSPDGSDHFPVSFEKIKHMILTEPTLTVEELAKIAVPTLVLAADHDLMTIDHTFALFKAIPNAQLSVFPGATHALAIERAEEVGRVALRFLAG